jgi:retron-type reverse transcriptase
LVKANSTTNPKPAQIPSPAETILSLLRQDPDGKYSNAFEVLSQISTLRAAYEVIKSKPGNMVRGTTKKTLDGISLEEKASHSLRAEKFQWKPNRRVYIPKANGKRRPLGIASPRDKIIQQAMNMVMETVLEPKFHNSSHGFRPYRGCHTALREVRS